MRLNTLCGILAVVACLSSVSVGQVDSFGTGVNEFEIEFVTISGLTNPVQGYGIVNNDYCMGMYEITNDQWNKFMNAYDPMSGYLVDSNAYFTGTNVPTNNVSWYEAAQFINWLNTSTGHQAAYNFTGTPGTFTYKFTTWSASEADGSNLYRHKDAVYFLPTEDEWVKAAYWNGSSLQEYATKSDVEPTQAGWNFYDGGYATDPVGPWNVGIGGEELNGTYDMMGNVWELMEGPAYLGTIYYWNSVRGMRGGSYNDYMRKLEWDYPSSKNPSDQNINVGFRVARSSASVPEPSPGDANRDGMVDVSDLGILATYYGTTSGIEWDHGDFTGNGIVDVSDLGILATYYGYGTTVAAGNVPEPSTITLLLCGLVSLALPRRWR